MKKIPIIILILIMLFTAQAEIGMLLPVGPYTYDASNCMSYNYDSENTLYVDYSWGYIMYQYMTFEEADMSAGYFEKYYGAYNDWQIAEACIDIWYNESDTYQEINLEDIDLQYYPACTLFNCGVSAEYGVGLMAGALFIDENGILFADCYPYVSEDMLSIVREESLAKLYHNDLSVISPEAAETAYAERTLDTKPDVIQFDDDFTYDSTGCTSYTLTGDDFLSIVYGDYIVDITYMSHNDIIYLPSELKIAYNSEDTNLQLAKIGYTKYITSSDYYKDLKTEGSASDDSMGTLLFTARDNAYSHYLAGAICANRYGTLFIDVYHLYEEGWPENLQQLRDDVIENVGCIIKD